jgi:hypothetical protein
MTTPILQAGSMAFLDTFSGQVPCKVLSVSGDSTGNVCAPSPTVKVKLTAARGAYRKGETIESTGFHVYPRQCRVKRGCFYRINTNYTVKAS